MRCWQPAPASARFARSWPSPSKRCIAGATFCGGMKAKDAKRLKQLELENARLKRLVADQALDMTILKETLAG